jgi:hypothetical protein
MVDAQHVVFNAFINIKPVQYRFDNDTVKSPGHAKKYNDHK